MNLIKYADKVLCLIYKQYLDNKKNGLSKSKANKFHTGNIESDFPGENREDFRDTLNELKKAQYISLDIIGIYSITDDGIIYMENRFKNNINEITDFIAKFIP